MKFAAVKQAARGNWKIVLPQLGIEDGALDGHHHDCPGCGGIDRFRFTDNDGDGCFICSGGDDSDFVAGDGFNLLQHVLGLSAGESLKRVAKVLGVENQRLSPKEEKEINDRIAIRRRRQEESAIVAMTTLYLFELQARVHSNWFRGIPDKPKDPKDTRVCKCHVPRENVEAALSVDPEPQDRELKLARQLWAGLKSIYEKR